MSSISELIPHSGEMILIDRILHHDAHTLTTELVVRGDGFICGDDKTVPSWIGIEYMAQTIAAYGGTVAKQANIGFLLGTRRYNCNVSTFEVGTKLIISAKKIMQDGNLAAFECLIFGENVEVSATLNVYQPDSNEDTEKQ
jgi:predicted hotdog family 3-hydroxylacyl-ACP dehydratase